MSAKRTAIVLAHAFVGWVLCAATMGIGMAVTTLQAALIIHAIAAPIFFTVVSYVYFTRFNYTGPLQTALIFVGFVIVCGFLSCGVADQQESGYVWQPIRDVDTLCVDICINPDNWHRGSITKERAICVSYSLFTDKRIQPSPNEINEALGIVQAEWTSLREFLYSHYRTQEDFKFFYGHDYGWAFRFRNKGKQLTALFPNRDHFISLVILNGKQLRSAENLKLQSSARKAIDSANLYAEGRWLFIRVSGPNDVKDVEAMVDLKAQGFTAEVQSTRRKRSG